MHRHLTDDRFVAADRRIPKIVLEVTTLKTPGASVDVVVSEAGLAVNPARADLMDRLRNARLTLVSIEDLADMAAKAATRIVPSRSKEPVVAVSEYRDDRIIDEIRQIDEA